MMTPCVKFLETDSWIKEWEDCSFFFLPYSVKLFLIKFDPQPTFCSLVNFMNLVIYDHFQPMPLYETFVNSIIMHKSYFNMPFIFPK